MKKVYLVTYNSGPGFDQKAFHSNIKSMDSSGKITDWWHYIENAYLVVSTLDVNHMYDAIIPGIPSKDRLLIIEVKPSNSQGWLPTDAWKWIQKHY